VHGPGVTSKNVATCSLRRSGGGGFEKPLDGGDDLDGSGDGSVGRQRIEKDEQGSDFRVLCLGLGEGADFALEGGGVASVGADLDERGVSHGIDGVEIDFVSLERAEVMDLAATAKEFDEDSRFESMAEIIPANAFIDGNESRIDGIGLAGIDHALALGSGEERGGADEEGILEMGEEGVEAVLRNGQALGL
jgi:hypothetical protein